MKCNSCGRVILTDNGIIKEGVFEAVQKWGYFSGKDLEIHKFNLCEKCYDRITSSFVVPVEVSENNEALGV